jgi:hypothetical protein
MMGNFALRALQAIVAATGSASEERGGLHQRLSGGGVIRVLVVAGALVALGPGSARAADPVKGQTLPQVEAAQGPSCRVTLDASSPHVIWVDAYFANGLDVAFSADRDGVLRVGMVTRVQRPCG